MLILSATLSLASCAALIVGGAGAGAYSYIAGNLIRNYNADYYKAVRTSSNVMKQLKFTVTDKTGDALKTVLRGKRADGSPVTIVIEKVESRLTKIGVRNGVIGITNKKASEQVHRRIGQQLPVHVAKKLKRTAYKKKISTNKSKVKSAYKGPRPVPPPETAKVSQQYPATMAAPKAESADGSPFSQSTLYIYYRNDEHSIPTTAYNTLDRVAAHLLKNPALTIDIRGYTDSKGDPGDNLRVSQQRADAVRYYLIGKEVPAKRLKASGYGASNFLESNRTENLRAINRRIELQIKE